jgi:serine/threonine protein kinase
MTTEEPDLSGLVLDGRYALVRLLGMGGMGSVYEARHIRIAKSVAVKVLHREYAYKESFRRRFLREAQAASLIRHRNVVAVHDFGDDENVVYIVMELLEGRDLHALIHERAPLPWPEARAILLQIAAALGAAHERDVIHRDVKPANVFITDDPQDGTQVKVLDFGIARASTMTDPAPGDHGSTGSSRVFGTPTYMAPELAFGEGADARSDLYSLGVVAYRVLTGHLPFDGDVPYLVISRHANEPPKPLRSIEPSVPVGVEQVVLKALAKQPHDRFQSMASFARALASIDDDGVGVVPTALLLETGSTVARLTSEPAPAPAPAATPSRAPVNRRGAEAKTDVYAGHHDDEEHDERHDDEQRGGPSESSDVGTPVTDLGTERLPSRRRVTGVSDVVELGRTGFTERVDAEASGRHRPSGELDVSSGPTPVSTGPTPMVSTSGPVATVPAARPWGGLVRVLGLLVLVGVAAAVGAIMARSPETPAPVAEAGLARAPVAVEPEAEPVVEKAEPVEPVVEKAEPVAAGASTGDASRDGATTGMDGPPDEGTTGAAAEPPATLPSTRSVARKPTDARIKKKLARALQRACGAGSAGYRVAIEGFITAEGRVTGTRVLDAPGDTRDCLERVVEAQRFPPGELRTLDLAVTL